MRFGRRLQAESPVRLTRARIHGLLVRLHPDGSGTVRFGNDLYRRELTDLPPEYLRENLILILQDRFDLSKAEAEALLDSPPASDL